MMFIKFEVEQEEWVTREANPNDEWDRGCTDGSATILSATLVDKDSYNTLVAPDGVQKGDTIYLVWALYGTGDSFGSYGGKYELLEVCSSREEAEDRRTHFENVTDYSVPWNGYFEWLESLNIEELTL